MKDEERIDLQAVEGEVLGIVGGLVAELGGGPPGRAVALDDVLDRDLGLGSLERVELLLRLEQAFGVRLPDAVMAGADRPRDLVAAILAAGPLGAEAAPGPRPAQAPGRPAPGSVATLEAALRWHVEVAPERVHVILREEDGRERPITYGGLWNAATAVAAGLRSHGLEPHETVALMLRTEAAFFAAFFGVLLAGGVPVPIYPPFRPDRIEEYARRQAAILRNAEARVLVTFAEAARVAGLLRGHVPSLKAVTTVARLEAAAGILPTAHAATTDPALVQYTSGSTGEPKGVLLSHANILANIRAIGEAIRIRPDDVGVSWLPLYHDMGLIGSWLASLYFGIPIVILSPLAFLSRPARWLWALHAHHGTVSPAPNFAFDLCARKIGDDELRGLDLSAWRLAFNGSEPVSPDTIERFTRRFAPYGFRGEAMTPVYGLAEATVALAVPPPGREPRVDWVDRETFQHRRVAQAASAAAAGTLGFVSCGCPIPGHEVRIVDPTGRTLGERVEGRVEFRGPSVTAGYYRNPEATRAVCRDGWLDSGDLGYWAGGELFVTGRRKDLIIKAGRNLYPQELEEVAGEVPGVRKGCVAAFGVPDPALGTERLVLVAESREVAAGRQAALRTAIVDRVVAALGLPPDVVVIAPVGSVLKTSSGKIRRGATRDAYLAGVLGRRASARVQWVRLVAEELAARLRRLPARAAALAYGAYVAGLLALTLPALWGLLLLARDERRADRIVRRWCRVILACAGCRLRVTGLEHLEDAAPVVLAANHASYLDSVALLAALPVDFRFVAKRELAAAPLVGTVIRKAGHLTVERTDLSRSVADAARVTEALRRGVSVLVFPEGTFRRSPGLLPFRLGAFKTAMEAERPLVPVAIRGTREVLPADTWLPCPGPITVSVGVPVRPEARGWPELVRLRNLVRAGIASALGESPAAGAGPGSQRPPEAYG